MRLLIVTQVMDEENPILGFFVSWVREFSKHFEQIEVICLEAGEFSLPENVRVHSLGKENGTTKVERFFRYLFLLFSLRKNYTHVYAHMSPEFVIVGAPIWLVLRKKTTLWYNHTQKSFRLWLAARLVKIVFHTSPYAAPARFVHAKRMPAGIDTELFKPDGSSRNLAGVYFQGRVASAKHVDEICEAVREVRGKGIPAVLTVVGPHDALYVEKIRTEYRDLIKDKALVFLGPKKSSDTPSLYSVASVSVNLTASGNYDKAVLESMACETPVIVSSEAFADMIPEKLRVPEHNRSAMAGKIVAVMRLPEAEYHELGAALRREVVEKHSLPLLGSKLFRALSSL